MFSKRYGLFDKLTCVRETPGVRSRERLQAEKLGLQSRTSRTPSDLLIHRRRVIPQKCKRVHFKVQVIGLWFPCQRVRYQRLSLFEPIEIEIHSSKRRGIYGVGIKASSLLVADERFIILSKVVIEFAY